VCWVVTRRCRHDDGVSYPPALFNFLKGRSELEEELETHIGQAIALWHNYILTIHPPG
jgi:hypothetical protein